MAGFVAATAILLAVMSIFAYGPNQVSAQITPSNFQSSDTGAGPMGQAPADPVQNSTASNITQLATVPPTVNQPIIPASLTPVVEESDESDSGSSNDDEDDNDGNDGGDGNDGNDGGDGNDGNDGGDGGDMFDGAFDGGFPFD